MSLDIWPLVHAERRALLADLKTIPDAAAWDTPSLCEQWTVRDCLAHMTSTARTSPVAFATGLLPARFSLKRFVASGVERERDGDLQATIDNFEAALESTTAPPGPKLSWLGETIVHAEDIRHALGMVHDYPPEALRAVADFYLKSDTLIGARSRVAGLRLEADNADWSHGSGLPVRGPLLALLMAMAGRIAFLDELSGTGVSVLRVR